MKNKPNYPYNDIPLIATARELMKLPDEELARYAALLTENTLYWSVAQQLNTAEETDDATLNRWTEEKASLKSAIREMGARYVTAIAEAYKDSHPEIRETLARLHASSIRIRQEFGEVAFDPTAA